jgi:hypothetical protein
MIIYLIIGILVLLLAYLSFYDKNNLGLLFSFILIFLFLAFRYDYGNDYNVYFKLFNDINKDPLSFINGKRTVEVGWVIINRIFKPFGFFSMVFFLAIVNCFAYFRMINKFVDRKYYWFAAFIYYFNTYFLLIQLSAMRQCMAIVMFIFAIDYILTKRYFKAAILIFLAISFHYSALILVPVIFLMHLLKIRMRLIHIIIVEVIYLSLFILSDIYQPLLRSVALTLLGEKYLFYLNPANTNPSILNALVYSSLLFILLFYYNRFNSDYQLLIKIFIAGLVLLPAGFILPLSSRLALYFLPLSIIIYPKVLEILDYKLFRQLFIIGVIFIISLRLITFLTSDTYKPHYMVYSTFIQTFFK